MDAGFLNRNPTGVAAIAVRDKDGVARTPLVVRDSVSVRRPYGRHGAIQKRPLCPTHSRHEPHVILHLFFNRSLSGDPQPHVATVR